jgi:hypothetical protein
LYYLQSRYYNPEWGRFINADVIVGSVGILLSHNVFAYCNNNAINMIDDSGFLCSRADEGASGPSTFDKVLNALNEYNETFKGTIINSLADSAIGAKTAKAVTTKQVKVDGMTKFASNSVIKVVKKATNVGVVGGVFAGISGTLNFKEYGAVEGAGRTLFDIGGMALTYVLIDSGSKYVNQNNSIATTSYTALGIGFGMVVSNGVSSIKEKTISKAKEIIINIQGN